ncbi:Mevalonate kinase [hydrothermal vent metagenome]|uniref:Mevalonate kinase n=1 Tax=hydrothermal vent metagenome TaxID=652676 RepID=A0A3B0W0F9_9ZZZZ
MNSSKKNPPPPIPSVNQWQSQAPANTMILGEHSVVYGHPAIACALNQFITIDWQCRTDNHIHIHSELATFKTQLNSIETHPKLQFVIKALQAFKPHLKHGLNITIRSDFSSTIGLGSSAAVLAAMLHGLKTITQQDFSTLELFNIGHAIILDIQKRGSGTDLAASLMGGGIFFEPATDNKSSPKITQLTLNIPISLIYVGYKTPTSEVLAQVAKHWQEKPEALKTLYQQMGELTQDAFNALQKMPLRDERGKNLNFYHSIIQYQALMEQLGVSDPTLNRIIGLLIRLPTIHAAKISGSGLGDCVLGLGTIRIKPQHRLNAFQIMQIHITPLGATTQTIESSL